MRKSMTYADAGVDVDKGNKLIDSIKSIAKQTKRPGVIGSIGGFGALFAPNLSDMEKPVLVSSTDGVGTKLKVAFMMDKHDTIGIDLVAMCVNDIAVQGAEPLFFLDYIAMGELNNNTATDIIKGIAEGCKQARCALIGGETAEMPDVYKQGEYDLAGFAVGAVDDHKIIDGSEIRMGQKIIGISSSGLHSNGYSLVRKICFEVLKLKIDDYVADLGTTIGEELLKPTKIYSDLILSIVRTHPAYAFAHITGGGINDNIIRVIPKACKAVIKAGSWDVPPIFKFLQDAGNITDLEMRRTFNNGIGLMAVVSEESAQPLLEMMNAMDEKAFIIGEIAGRKNDEPQVEWV